MFGRLYITLYGDSLSVVDIYGKQKTSDEFIPI